ncbi:MAG: SRPBCC family protein [Bryobacteraceae bacterium]|nr:SRPBCC family protein [Bryobacteraceae bacterium]MDW8376612.1 SRPBCC family protein [Bryobacterales bacterium]
MLQFEFETWIDASPEQVWAFHQRPDIFELLTPPGKSMEVIKREGGLETGARVEFRLRFGPISIPWIAVHVDHETTRFFVDEQLRGPFRFWRHEHRFEPDQGGTRLKDRVRCSLPGGPVADWLLGWFVRLELKQLFRHRHAVTKRFCEANRVV